MKRINTEIACVQLMVANSTALATEVHSCSLDGNIHLYTAVETFFFCKCFFSFCVMKQIHRPLLLLIYTGVLAHSTPLLLLIALLVSC